MRFLRFSELVLTFAFTSLCFTTGTLAVVASENSGNSGRDREVGVFCYLVGVAYSYSAIYQIKNK